MHCLRYRPNPRPTVGLTYHNNLYSLAARADMIDSVLQRWRKFISDESVEVESAGCFAGSLIYAPRLTAHSASLHWRRVWSPATLLWQRTRKRAPRCSNRLCTRCVGLCCLFFVAIGSLKSRARHFDTVARKRLRRSAKLFHGSKWLPMQANASTILKLVSWRIFRHLLVFAVLECCRLSEFVLRR